MKFFANIFILSILIIPFNARAEDDSVVVKQISGSNIKKMIGDTAGFVLIDARRVSDYNQEHISGAISLPATDVNVKTLAEVAPEMDSKLVFYCQNPKCQASTIAAHKAIGAGYTYVYEYSGGIEDWKYSGFKTASVDE